jgi:hypothetical protein
MYNQTVSHYKDVLEALKQKMTETPAFKDRWDVFWDLVEVGSSFPPELMPAGAELRQQVNNLRAKILADLDSVNPAVDESKHRQDLLGFLARDEKIVAVGHSQGNLFMNRAYKAVQAIAQPQQLKVVSVASAAGEAFGPHFTANIDLVINTLRLVSGHENTLPATAPFFTDYLGLLPNLAAYGDGHGFQEIYLNPQWQMRSAVLGAVQNALQTVAVGDCSGGGLMRDMPDPLPFPTTNATDAWGYEDVLFAHVWAGPAECKVDANRSAATVRMAGIMQGDPYDHVDFDIQATEPGSVVTLGLQQANKVRCLNWTTVGNRCVRMPWNPVVGGWSYTTRATTFFQAIPFYLVSARIWSQVHGMWGDSKTISALIDPKRSAPGIDRREIPCS